jgi:hypothetical protein
MINRIDISSAIQIALVSLASYLCGFYFSSLFHRPSAAMGGLWALISGVLVLQSTWRGVIGLAPGTRNAHWVDHQRRLSFLVAL